MNELDKQLNQIQEIEPIIAATSVIATGLVATHLATIIFAAKAFSDSFKIDYDLSRRLNGILKSGDKWIVHRYPESGPSAFSLGFGRHIFVTSALVRLLDEGELDAVLLHEAYHAEKKHTPKQLAVEYPFYYLATLLAIYSMGVVPLLISGIIVFLLTKKVGSILYRITISKRNELKADDFAVKNGYGKELVGALKKLEMWVKRHHRKIECGKICQIMEKIDNALDEHPPIEKRIRIALETMNKTNVKSLNFSKIKNTIQRIWKTNG